MVCVCTGMLDTSIYLTRRSANALCIECWTRRLLNHRSLRHPCPRNGLSGSQARIHSGYFQHLAPRVGVNVSITSCHSSERRFGRIISVINVVVGEIQVG